MADLLTLAEYKAKAGYDALNTQYDDEITALLPAATAIIRNYTGRDFGSTLVTEQRIFEYDGSGWLDIDDCVTITSVTLTVTWGDDFLLATDEWAAGPPRRDDSPVYYYILMPGFYGGVSGEMGFSRNLDVLLRDGRFRALPPRIKVVAQWGWPTVPEDVKQAAYWTIAEWRSRGTGGEGLTSESIESFSRSWGNKQGAAVEPYAVPARARDILAFYSKPNV